MTILILSGALGFLLASLIALFLAPPLWRHAVRVTTKRLNQQSPRMIDEGHADRDQMRAEFAVTTRKMEVKLDRLKEKSDTQLIELSKAEKKRDRLQGKIESLQTALEKHEETNEKLNLKVDRLISDIGRKSEQLTTQAERLARQTEMLNTQAATLEENALKLEERKQKIADLTAKEVDYSAIISKQDLEISKLRAGHQKARLSQKAEDAARQAEYERMTREVSDSLEKISGLKQDLEDSNQSIIILRQEAARNKEKINGLIREIHTKDEKIMHLDREIATTANRDQVSVSDTPVTATDSREDNDNKVPSPLLPAIRTTPLTAITDTFTRNNYSTTDAGMTTSTSQLTWPKKRPSQHSATTSQKTSKPMKASEPPSLAERIRALQADHPKSM